MAIPSSQSVTVLTAMFTPALLILATGSLVATALTRLGRIVDRARVWRMHGPEEMRRMNVDQAVLKQWRLRHRNRALLTERAVFSYFAAVAFFVADCLAIAIDYYSAFSLTWLPVTMTIAGMTLLLIGCVYMVLECQLSSRQVDEELTLGLEQE